MSGLLNLKLGTAEHADIQPTVQIASAAGAIAIKPSTVFITKGTAAAMTLAAPTAGTHDGVEIVIVAATAAAHTVTNSSPGFNGAGTSGDVATFGGAVGDNIRVVAYNGKWHVLSSVNVTLG